MRQHFVISVAVAALGTVWGWFAMPAGEIPVHFGAGGEADGWGSRTELTVVFAAITAGLALFMGWMARWASTMPWSMVNIPYRDKEFWQLPENDARGRARLRDDMFLTGAWTMWLMAAVQTIAVLSVRRGAIDVWLGTAMVVVIVGMTAWLLVVMLRRTRFYRRRDEA